MKTVWRRGAAMALAAGVLLLAFQAAPAASKPFTLGVGTKPAIAVDAAGTAHIVWDENANPGDDRVVYCRLPRGARACEMTRALPAPAEDFDGPRVVLADGEPIVVSQRCCISGLPRNSATVAFRSADGGNTFAAPSPIGNNELDRDPILGPGAGTISTVGSQTDGTFFQAMPLSAAPPGVQARAALDDDVPGPTGDTGDGSVALVDSLTPIGAFRSIQTTGPTLVYARVFGGAGSPNSSATWHPSRLVGAGDDPELAGGLRGAYLLDREGAPAKRRYVVRPYDPVGETLGVPFGSKPTKVSPKGDPIFADFEQDAGGNLQAIWVQNDVGREPLMHARSLDGRRWGKPRSLAETRDRAYGLQLGAGPDGGGWAIFTRDSGGGEIKAVPIPPVGGGEGNAACVPSVTYGKTVALATQGCFSKHGQSYEAAGAVRLNGLDLYPDGGAKLTIDTGQGTLTANGKFLVKAGNDQLDRVEPAWKLPKEGGDLKDLAGNPATFDAGKAGVEFLGLPVSGWVTPKLTGGGASELPVNLKLPAPFEPPFGSLITGHTTLRLDNQHGLVLDGAEVHAGEIYLGLARVDHLSLAYTNVDPPLLQGEAEIALPVSGTELETQFGLKGGAFDYGSGKITFDPGRPLATEFAVLQEINFLVATDPTRIVGSVRATAGEEIAVGGTNFSLAEAIAALSYVFSDPGVFTAEGSGKILGFPAAHTQIRYVTSGLLTVDGHLEVPSGGGALGGSSIAADANGAVSLNNGAFNLAGHGDVCGIPQVGACLSGINVLVSSKAAVACTDVNPTEFGPSISVGLAYEWQGGFDPLFGGCDTGDYEVALSATAARRARGGAGPASVRIGKGLPQANLAIEGVGGPPAVTITSPDGTTLSSGPLGAIAANELGSVDADGATGITRAALAKPQRGQWSISPLPGSAPIARVLEADGLPQPKVTGKVVRGAGRKRVLHYTVRKIPGQKVRFYERGPSAYRAIGKASGKRGRLAFAPAPGKAEKRTIQAQVSSFGLPRALLDVTRYRAPSSRPGKPHRLRVRRRGSKALVTWRRTPRARAYVVVAKLRDGRALSITTKRPRAKIRGVPGIDSARIRVAGLEGDNSRGRAAKAKLRPKPKRRPRHRHG